MAMSFTGAMKQFFGLRGNEGVTGFSKELRELTYEDKLEFHRMLNEHGVACDPPTRPADGAGSK